WWASSSLRLVLVTGSAAADKKSQRRAERCAHRDGEKTFPQTEREPGADGENRSGSEQDRGENVDADENENTDDSHLADPVVETFQPLLDGQKSHREKERDHT